MDHPILLHAEPGFLVCLKPAGVECEHELPALLSSALPCEVKSLYCIHRLDRSVGGVMVWARSAHAAATLSKQIQAHRFQKEYLAVCSGRIEPPEGEMRDFLFKDSVRQKAFVARNARGGVKEALLHYQLLAYQETHDVSLVRVALHTGRFHQIRCQFAARRHPLLGDGKYGSREKGCPIALWSCRIAFFHPETGRRIVFQALPETEFPWSAFPPIDL